MMLQGGQQGGKPRARPASLLLQLKPPPLHSRGRLIPLRRHAQGAAASPERQPPRVPQVLMNFHCIPRVANVAIHRLHAKARCERV